MILLKPSKGTYPLTLLREGPEDQKKYHLAILSLQNPPIFPEFKRNLQKLMILLISPNSPITIFEMFKQMLPHAKLVRLQDHPS